jgi:hypothetical protein
MKPEVQKALFGDREVPKEAIARVLEDVEAIKKQFDASGDSIGYGKRVREYIAEQRELDAISLRTKMQNIARAKRQFNFLRQFTKDPAEGFKAMMEKTTDLVNGGSNSLIHKARAMKDRYHTYLFGSLEEKGLDGYLLDPANDKEFRIAHDAIANGQEVPAGISKEAVEAAKIVQNHYDMVFADKRDANVPVRRMRGYNGSQSHNATEVGKVDFETWFKDTLPQLDLRRTFGPHEADMGVIKESLRSTYKEIRAGVYGQDKSIMDDSAISDFMSIGNQRNIQRKLSESRTLHFRDGESYHNYATKYGRSVIETLVNDINYTSHQLAILGTFGTNPEAGFHADFDRLRSAYKSEGNMDAVSRLDAQKDRLTAMFRQSAAIDHTAGNNTAAKIGANIRALQAASKLGLTGIRSGANVAGAAVALKNATGKNFMEAIHDTVKEWVKSVPEGARDTFGKKLRQFSNDEQQSLIEQLSQGRFDGMANKSARFLMKYGGLDLNNNTTKFATATLFQSSMGETAHIPFKELPPQKQAFMLEAGFTEHDYKLFSKATETAEDGRVLLTPEAMEKLDDKDVKAAMKANGVKGMSASAYKKDLGLKYRAAIIQQSDIATTTAGVREQSRLNLGTKIGSLEGETLRVINQFKSFTAQSINISRKFLNATPDPTQLANGVLRSKGKDMTGFAQFLVGTTAAALAANYAVAMLTGRDLPDPRHIDTWLDAAGKSGMGGMQTDFLVGEWDKYNAAEAILGPTVGSLAGAGLGTYSLARDRALKGENPFSAKVLRDSNRLIRGNIPFQNFPLIKQGLDYLQYDVINESLNPGAKAKYELRKARQERGG